MCPHGALGYHLPDDLRVLKGHLIQHVGKDGLYYEGIVLQICEEGPMLELKVEDLFEDLRE